MCQGRICDNCQLDKGKDQICAFQLISEAFLRKKREKEIRYWNTLEAQEQLRKSEEEAMKNGLFGGKPIVTFCSQEQNFDDKKATYVKKPIYVEAVQWTGNNVSEVDNFINHAILCENKELIIPTLEGDMRVSIGDYIIKGIKGEFYPCKPDIFRETYNKVHKEKTK